jgi:hypothetical protein
MSRACRTSVALAEAKGYRLELIDGLLVLAAKTRISEILLELEVDREPRGDLESHRIGTVSSEAGP